MSLYAKYKDLGDKEPKMDPKVMDSLCPKLTSMDHKKHVIGNNRVCVIDVYGDWCGPCKAIAPAYAALAQKYGKPGQCALVKEDIDMKLSSNIRGVPTFLFFKEGQYVDSVTGADLTGPEGVEAKLQRLLSN